MPTRRPWVQVPLPAPNKLIWILEYVKKIYISDSVSDLANKKCIPCEGGIPGFDITEIHKYLKMVDGWEIKSDESKIYYLIKEFKFKNFLESQNFVNIVGDIAEAEGHHPDIWFGWGYAKIKIFTHAIKGLHESDFILAAKVDKIS